MANFQSSKTLTDSFCFDLFNRLLGHRNKNIRNYYEHLCANKLDNLEEIDNIPKNMQLIQTES